jgi:hypothetical protein
MSLPDPAPNPYEVPCCQETNYSWERIFLLFFPLFPFRHSQPPASCPDFISL